jgi:hypothetical protein
MTKKHVVMNFIFLDMAVAGTICGYALHKYTLNPQAEALVCGGMSIVAIFVGMILAFMASDDRTREKIVNIEIQHQKKLQNIVITERLNCSKVAINMARAMTDRVANTIVAKYVEGLSNEEKRKNVLDGVNQIVMREMQSLTKALFDELKAQEKT